MKWIAIAITVSKKTILFPCGGLINRRTKMMVKELIKSLEHFDEQEDIKNTFLFTEEKVYKIIIKENEDDV